MKNKFRQIFRGGALLLCILFFMVPLVQCSHDSNYRATGLQIATGTGNLYDTFGENAVPIVFILVIIPAVLLILTFVSKSYKTLSNASIAGLIAKIGFIIATQIKLTSGDYSDSGVELTIYNWFIVAIYIGLICLANLFIKNETDNHYT